MPLPWRFAPQADDDLTRVFTFLEGKSSRSALRARARIINGLVLISEHPRVGRSVGGAIRQVVVRFGRTAYVIRYRLTADEILITRIWHSKERRP